MNFCNNCDRPSGDKEFCGDCAFWQGIAFWPVSEMARRGGIDQPKDADDLRRWAGTDRARLAALAAAKMPCVDADGRPCLVEIRYSRPAARVMSNEERTRVAMAAYQKASGL